MPDKPFVINDRRKFTAEGELRQEQAPAQTPAQAPASEPNAAAPSAAPEPNAGPRLVTPAEMPAPLRSTPIANATTEHAEASSEQPPEGASPEGASPDELPPLTAEQVQQVKHAYDAMVERLDTALRVQNLGAEPPPAITFQSVIQSLFMQALVMLGGAAEPGQPVSVDPMGARQVIAMIEAVVAKAQPSLTPAEERFCENVLFELRMGFLEITQRLAQQAAIRAAQAAQGTPGGPSIVR